MSEQLALPFVVDEARSAAAALLAAALAGEAPPHVPVRVLLAIPAAELDEIDAIAERTRPRVDWADPDSFDAETAEWYDAFANPYARGPEPVERCEFYLGTHRPHWLYAAGSRERRPAGPLFVSARQLRHARHTAYPRCDTRYAIDSGGFTEIRKHGGWATSPEAYARQVSDLEASTGTLAWAAIQDWMVERDALACTGLDVAEHQRRTVASFLRLRELAPHVRWLPVLQGQTLDDYLAHVEMYAAAGVHLASIGRVGVGSVCRRQSTEEIATILAALAACGLRLHGFGVKTGGLERAAKHLASADSLAWSIGERYAGGDANSQDAAEQYRDRMRAIAGVA